MEKSESSGTWADVVLLLLRTFLLLRDIFGYALPGGVFIAIGLIEGKIQLKQVAGATEPFHLPAWAWAILAVAACYVIGQVLATVTYLPIDYAKVIAGWRGKKDWVAKNPTEVNADALVARAAHPDLFAELDRRETIAILIASTLAAFLLGWAQFCVFHLQFCTLLLIAGLILLLDFLTTIPHLQRVRLAIVEASGKMSATPAPTKDLGDALVDFLRAAAAKLK